MSDLFSVLNVIIALAAAKWAKEEFQEERNGLGWMWVVLSAFNTAAFLNVVLT
jgi:hypothetical protein